MAISTDRSPRSTNNDSPKKKANTVNNKKKRTKSPEKSSDKNSKSKGNKDAAETVEVESKTDKGKKEQRKPMVPECKKNGKESVKKGRSQTKKDTEQAVPENEVQTKKKGEEQRVEKRNDEKDSNNQAQAKETRTLSKTSAEKAKENKKSDVKIEADPESGFVNVDGSDNESEPTVKSPPKHVSPRRLSSRTNIKNEISKVKTPLPTPTPSPEVQIIDVKQAPSSTYRRLSSPSYHGQYNEQQSSYNAYNSSALHNPVSSYHHTSSTQQTYPAHQQLSQSMSVTSGSKSDRKRASTYGPGGQSMYNWPNTPSTSQCYPGTDNTTEAAKQSCQTFGLQAPPMDYSPPAPGLGPGHSPEMPYQPHPAYSSTYMYPHGAYGMYMINMCMHMENMIKHAGLKR